ncbi:bacteriophage f237 ORF5 [Vibrio sp. JCM 19052]|nr:bacteriophage f237 ORF5 [Vibrio sp. JCM 19052]
MDNSLDSIEGLLTGSEFGTPTGTAITGEIFTFEDLMDLQDTIQAKTESIETYVDDIKGLVSISTNFNNGTLSDKSFSIKGATVESGLQRFDSVSGYVRPVVLFICALIALWVLFGNRSK